MDTFKNINKEQKELVEFVRKHRVEIAKLGTPENIEFLNRKQKIDEKMAKYKGKI